MSGNLGAHERLHCSPTIRLSIFPITSTPWAEPLRDFGTSLVALYLELCIDAIIITLILQVIGSKCSKI